MKSGFFRYVNDGGTLLRIERRNWRVIRGGVKVAILMAATVLSIALYSDFTAADTVAELVYGLDCMGEHL